MIDELATDEASIVRAIVDDVADGIGMKLSKCGGLTRGRRQRDVCRAAGLTMSVQDAWGSEVAFAAVLHLAQTIPAQNLRCVLDLRDDSPVVTAELDVPIRDGGLRAPEIPGLGVSPDLAVLGDPVASWT